MTYFASITTLVGAAPYNVPFADHGWEVVGGYEAPVQAWLVPVEVADQIMADLAAITANITGTGAAALGREVTLKFGDPGVKVFTVNRVVVVGTMPADNLQRRYLMLSDVRWYLGRMWLEFDVNERRRLGDTRVVGGSLLTGVDLTIAPNIAYAPWSINNGSAYNWTSLMQQLISYCTTGAHGRPNLTFVIDPLSVTGAAGNVLQPSSVSAVGTTGLGELVETMSGVSIYTDLAGTIHIYDRVPGSEIDFIDTRLEAQDYWDHGSMVLIDNSPRRPAAGWHVYTDYEVEIRATYNASGAGLWAVDLDVFPNSPYLFPVLQTTDNSLFIPTDEFATGRTVGQGTWVNQESAMAAWGGKSISGFDSNGNPFTYSWPTLTDDIVADNWMGDGLQVYTVGGAIASYDPLWAGRITSLMKSYRVHFQINPAFWARVRHAWSLRCAIFDPSTGTRAPSPVYANYNHVNHDDFVVGDSGVAFMFGVNSRDSYPADGLLAHGRPTGFLVEVIDEELGIIAIDRDITKFPWMSQITISPCTIPNPEAGELGINGASLLAGPGSDDPALQQLDHADDWQLAVILSCMPSAPNDLGRLYETPVTLAAAAAAAGLTGAQLTGALKAYGPDIETRTRLTDARVAWPPDDDPSKVASILALFGCDDTGGAITQDTTNTPIVPMNLVQELRPLALAVAASELLTMLDHYEGTQSYPADPGFVPIGSIVSVRHHVAEGRFQSTVKALGHGPLFNPLDFVHGTAREFILKQIAEGQR